MPKSLRFYKRDPQQFIDGVEGLSLEEVGAYTLLLDHMYARGGALPDSPATICGMLGCDRRVWKRLRLSLIQKGKLVDRGDGFLSNRRVEQELAWLEDTRQARVRAGSTGGQVSSSRKAKALKQKETDEANAQALAQAKSNQSLEEEIDTSEAKASDSPTSPSKDGSVVVPLRPPLPIADAVLAYNRTAEACGWRRCKEVSQKRRAAITARLRKRGIEEWEKALAIAAKSDWVNAPPEKRAKGHETWKPNLDWFAREDTFIRLFEDADAGVVAEIETEEDWVKRLKWWRDHGSWRDKWGPKIGEYGCRVPSRMLSEAAS